MTFVFVAVCAVGTFACGGGKYKDAKKAIAKGNVALEGFLQKMDKVDIAKDASAAINTFADAMEIVVPEMREMEKNIPN